jgi:hypothetical protein
MNISQTTRLNLIKNTLAIFLLATIAFTWPLWLADRYYPLFPGADLFSSVNVIIAYALPALLIISLLLVFLLRKPRFFIFLSLVLCLALLALDTSRLQYWFYFYTLLLLILLGYNWRVDNTAHFSSSFNAIRIVLALVYLYAAIQHFNADFIQHQWPQFIKPFEKIWTPEQCAYLLKVAYAIPIIELFMVLAFFMGPARIAAISFSFLFHIFSLVVLFIQPQVEAAVILWHFCMLLLVLFAFAGSTSSHKDPGFSLALYPAIILLAFGLGLPLYTCFSGNNKSELDLMQAGNKPQYIYLTEEAKNKLPLYLQSFALNKEKGFHKLSVSYWALHETKTKQVLGSSHLMQLAADLGKNYGAEALVAIPENKANGSLALK